MHNFINRHISLERPYCSLRGILFRVFFVFGIGVLTFLLTVLLVVSNVSPCKMPFEGYFIVGMVYVLLIEGLILIDHQLNRYIEVDHDTIKRRFLIQFVLGLCWFVFMITVSMVVFGPKYVDDEKAHYISQLVIIFGGFLLLHSNGSLLGARMMNNYKEKIKEAEHLKQEKLKMDYQSLQDQLNPHFLFNNLSVLISEIQYNPKNATMFAEGISDVYRYVLKNRERRVVSLRKELEFVHSYNFLHQTRIGDGFQFNCSLPDNLLDLNLPPMSMHTLVDNAIKHNRVCSKTPLVIRVYIEGRRLVVENTYQPKSSTYSTHTGLNNLRKRYELLGAPAVIVEQTSELFTVKIPLLD